MKNSTCVICTTEFPPREKKLYCSDACKQKGYSKKKEKHGPEPGQAIGNTFTISVKMVEEYKEYREKYGTTPVDDIVSYCFFRKNLSEVNNIDEVREYFNQISDQIWDEWATETGIVGEKFKEYKRKYFSEF